MEFLLKSCGNLPRQYALIMGCWASIWDNGQLKIEEKELQDFAVEKKMLALSLDFAFSSQRQERGLNPRPQKTSGLGIILSLVWRFLFEKTRIMVSDASVNW